MLLFIVNFYVVVLLFTFSFKFPFGVYMFFIFLPYFSFEQGSQSRE